MKRARRAWPILLGASILVGAFGIAACEGETPAPNTTPDGATFDLDSSTQQPETSVPLDSAAPVDAGGPDAAEITDGGGLPPEDDGGTTDLDGGYDAGPACQLLTTGAFVQSACSSRLVVLAGGALTTTTYVLQGVTALGSKTYCTPGGGYLPYDHRGAIEVTATSPSSATFEFVDQYRKSGGQIIIRPTTIRYDVAATATGGTLTYVPQTCAAKPAPKAVKYSVGTIAATGKKSLILELPYGATGTALYRYVEP